MASQIKPFMAALNLLLCFVLLAAIDLSLGEQTEGIPFFNDSGELTLPRESVEELQESMPELEVFPLPNRASLLPKLGASPDPLDLAT